MALRRSPQGVARQAVARARQDLSAGWPELVERVIWYGAVDIDPAHLVVWVLLSGSPAQRPEWFFPTGDRAADAAMAGDLLDATYEMTHVVRRCFADLDWPRPDRVSVGFDAEERVAPVGFIYFK